MKLAPVIAALQQLAPEHLAEGWDQVGLHLAGNGKRVRKAMLCIDLTPAVVDEAIANKCQLVVAYHPPIFRPLARLADRDWKERMLAKAVRSGLAVYSPHTSLDAVRNGMNDWLCDGLGAHRVAAHPDNEPPIDVGELAGVPEPERNDRTPGRCIHLRRPISAEALVRRVKRHLNLKRIKVAIPPAYGDEYPGKIGSIAVCVGAGGSCFERYRTADAYVTGEMQHHQVLDMVQQGKVVILAGHTNSERPFLSNYRDAIIGKCDAVEWMLSTKDTAPLEIV